MIESYSRENIYNDNNTDNAPAGIHCLLLQFYLTQQTFLWMKTSFVFVFRRCLQDIMIKTNMFDILIRLQKTSWRRLDQDQYIRLRHTSSRCLQEVFKTSSSRLQDVLQKHLQDIFKTLSRRFADVFKTSCKDIFKMLSRRIIKLYCSC